MTRLVSVIGAGLCNAQEAQVASEVGRLLAEQYVGVVCGGLGGVMEAVCRGAYEAGGMTVGILPGNTTEDANAFVRVPIATGLSEARNILVVRAGIAVIAIGGEYGTLSEIGFALKIGKRVIGLNTWDLGKQRKQEGGILIAQSAEEAVRLALQ